MTRTWNLVSVAVVGLLAASSAPDALRAEAPAETPMSMVMATASAQADGAPDGRAHGQAAAVRAATGGADAMMAPSREAQARAAILAAVRARMGSTAQVSFGKVIVRGLEDEPARIVAVPDAGARAGGAVRWLLFDLSGAGAAGGWDDAATQSDDVLGPGATGGVSPQSEAGAPGRATKAIPIASAAPGQPGRRVGSVDAETYVALPHLRARRALAPRTIVGAGDVETAMGDIGRVSFDALPSDGAIVGARVVRPIAAGQPIVASMVAAVPLVRSGDEVRTLVRVGALEARGVAVAAQTGAMGDEIRVVNADSRRTLKARVVGAGQVEVMH